MEQNTNQKRWQKMAPFLIIGAGMCWGIIGVFSKIFSGHGMDPVQITFLRCTVAMTGLWLYTLIFDRKKLKIRIKDLWLFLGTGGVGVALMYTFYFTTMENGTVAVAAVLLYTAPCMVMVMSAVFFHERITMVKISALVLAMVGCIFATGLVDSLITGVMGTVTVVGIVSGIVSAFCYASYTIVGNVALKRYEPLTILNYSFLVAVVVLFPFCRPVEVAGCVAGNHLWLALLLMGLLSTLTPYVLYTQGLKFTEPGKASVMAFVEPMVSVLVSIFVFREGFTILSGIGIALIFTSVVLLNLKQKKKPGDLPASRVSN